MTKQDVKGLIFFAALFFSIITVESNFGLSMIGMGIIIFLFLQNTAKDMGISLSNLGFEIERQRKRRNRRKKVRR